MEQPSELTTDEIKQITEETIQRIIADFSKSMDEKFDRIDKKFDSMIDTAEKNR